MISCHLPPNIVIISIRIKSLLKKIVHFLTDLLQMIITVKIISVNSDRQVRSASALNGLCRGRYEWKPRHLSGQNVFASGPRGINEQSLLPVQWNPFPSKPELHWQRKPGTSSTQVALPWHGFDSHSKISVKIKHTCSLLWQMFTERPSRRSVCSMNDLSSVCNWVRIMFISTYKHKLVRSVTQSYWPKRRIVDKCFKKSMPYK